jgi:Xaa-Pro aminopeptidase
MKPISINQELFVGNRERLRGLLQARSLAVVNANDIMPTNADGTLGFHQNADLFYLTGIRQEESILVLAPDAFDPKLREVLFLREPNELLRIWEGHKLSKEEATQISGIQTVKWLGEFRTVLHQLMCESEHVYLNSNEHYRAQVDVESRDARFVELCQRQYPLHHYHRLARLMHALRVVKSPIEIQLIREASRITGQGFERVLRFVKPGVNEPTSSFGTAGDLPTSPLSRPGRTTACCTTTRTTRCAKPASLSFWMSRPATETTCPT